MQQWPNFGLLAALAQQQQRKSDLWPCFKSAANPILALIANRSSLFGFLRPVNPIVQPNNNQLLDLPTILMLQNNILTMINTQNRQVKVEIVLKIQKATKMTKKL